MVQTAKLFKNGRSQAVRLPKEFRFEGAEVEIHRDSETGDVVLKPAQEKKTVRRKKPVQREENIFVPHSPVPEQRKLSLQELYAILDQADFPRDFFKREVHKPRKLDLF